MKVKKEIYTAKEWETWLANAEHGDRCVYFVGSLSESFSTVGILAWDAAVRGLVTLYQQRPPEGRFNEFEYIAQRVPPEFGKAHAPARLQR